MRFTILGLVALLGTAAFSQTDAEEWLWLSCSDALSELAEHVETAHDTAETIDWEANAVQTAEHDLQDCLADPEYFDYYSDGCRTLRDEYQSAKFTYEWSLDTLQSELDEVGRSVINVESECGYSFIPQPQSLGGPRESHYCSFMSGLRTRDRDLFASLCSKDSQRCHECFAEQLDPSKAESPPTQH